MTLFDEMADQGHEQVVFWSEPEAGYRGIIAVHDTSLGPALGGTRFWNYPTETDALVDVLRLARGMTYKAAVAGVELGGGKSVIIGDNRTSGREAIFQAHGRAIQSLGGRYIAAEDVGTTVQDMEFVRMETEYVTGLHSGSGDPSPLTAYGTLRGIQACAIDAYGAPSLLGRHIAVQGLGSVGSRLCAFLAEAGAQLTVADLDPERVDRVVSAHGAAWVSPEEIHRVDADVFAPCALGAVLDERTIGELQVDIVAGAANNQLAKETDGEELHQRGILYAPDYVINAGGVISVYGELHQWPMERSRRKAGEIHATLLRIFEAARRDGVSPVMAANRLAEERLRKARRRRRSAP